MQLVELAAEQTAEQAVEVVGTVVAAETAVVAVEIESVAVLVGVYGYCLTQKDY